MPTFDPDMARFTEAEQREQARREAAALFGPTCSICGATAVVGDLCAGCWRDEQAQSFDDYDRRGGY